MVEEMGICNWIMGVLCAEFLRFAQHFIVIEQNLPPRTVSPLVILCAGHDIPPSF